MTATTPRQPFGLDRGLDAALHLLDRQVVDVDGHLVCKVDDVELTERGGTVVVTGLLVGPSALLPRLGGGPLVRLWALTAPSRAGRDDPGWVDVAEVERVDTAVALRRRREGVVRPQPQAGADVVRHRLDDLLGLAVHDAEGRALGTVLDVRLRAGRPEEGRLVASHLVVGRGRAGVRLGYDRGAVAGPAVLAALLRWRHRHSVLVPLEESRVDRVTGTVHVRRPAGPLTGLGDVRQDGLHG